MKIGVITQANAKGQIVIPKKMREQLGITSSSQLHVLVKDNGIYVHPVKSVLHAGQTAEDYYTTLKKTQGSWAGDDWEETDKNRRKIEQKAVEKTKKATW